MLIPIIALMIPIVAIAAGMFRQWLKFKENQLKIQTEMTAEKSAQYAAHTERLEQRVRVLERVITDKGFDTAAQIEALRGIQSVEPKGIEEISQDMHGVK